MHSVKNVHNVKSVFGNAYNAKIVCNVKMCLKICVLRNCPERKDVFENVCNTKNVFNVKNLARGGKKFWFMGASLIFFIGF